MLINTNILKFFFFCRLFLA